MNNIVQAVNRSRTPFFFFQSSSFLFYCQHPEQCYRCQLSGDMIAQLTTKYTQEAAATVQVPLHTHKIFIARLQLLCGRVNRSPDGFQATFWE